MATQRKTDRGKEGQLLLPNFSSSPVMIRPGPTPGPMQRRRVRRKRPPPALEPQLSLPGLPDSLTVAGEEAPAPLPVKASPAAQDVDLDGNMILQMANSPAANRPVAEPPAAVKPILQPPVVERASAVNHPGLYLQAGNGRQRVALEDVADVVINSRHGTEFNALAAGYGKAGLPEPVARAVASRMAPLLYPDLVPRMLQGRSG